MVNNKLTETFTDTAEISRSPHVLGKIVHDLKNCMSIVVLNVGIIEAHPGHIACESRTIENLENTIHKMNCLLEDLAKFVDEGKQKRTAASRARIYRR